MSKFYLDSSENNGEAPEFALAWYDTEAEGREAAQQAAVKAPGTVFYVHKLIETHACIYKAEAKVELNTEVLIGTPDQS